MSRMHVVGAFVMAACVAWPVAALTQGAAKGAAIYDPATEFTTTGTIVQVLSAADASGLVGVHVEVKTDTGKLKVHIGPALFIGENNFWFQADDQIELTGSTVSHTGAAAVWARVIKKDGKTLTLRNERGAPLWKADGGKDSDGCGVAHPPMD
jgi:hypothetical protein